MRAVGIALTFGLLSGATIIASIIAGNDGSAPGAARLSSERPGEAVERALPSRVPARALKTSRTRVGSAGDFNISNALGVQDEPAIAIDPRNRDILLAGSNEIQTVYTAHVYSSTDGGATWTSSPNPPLPPAGPGYVWASDPAVAIGPDGRQYFAFIRVAPAASPAYALHVASRPSATAAWTTPARAVSETDNWADMPAIAIDTLSKSPHYGRIYVTWAKGFGNWVMLSHSDDHGVTWSAPLNLTGKEPVPGSATGSSIAIGPSGGVYVAWHDGARHAFLRSSNDGARTFGPTVTVGELYLGHSICGGANPFLTPAQPARCVPPNPTVSVDTSHDRYRGRVYVTYVGRRLDDELEPAGTPVKTTVAVFDSQLNLLFRRRLLERRSDSDQFLARSAVDRSTGRLWACLYDTSEDPSRRRARFVCSASSDGGTTWATPVNAASVTSDESTGTPRASGMNYGDYEGLAVAAGRAHPVWTDTREVGRPYPPPSNDVYQEQIYSTTIEDAALPAPLQSDQRPPRLRLSALPRVVRAGRARQLWVYAGDGGRAVKIRLTLDGREIRSLQAPTGYLERDWAEFDLWPLRRGRHVLVVRAVDPSLNLRAVRRQIRAA